MKKYFLEGIALLYQNFRTFEEEKTAKISGIDKNANKKYGIAKKQGRFDGLCLFAAQ